MGVERKEKMGLLTLLPVFSLSPVGWMMFSSLISRVSWKSWAQQSLLKRLLTWTPLWK